jgi:hypothetical protein
MDPKRLENVSGPAEEHDPADPGVSTDPPLDQIFQELASALKKMGEVLNGAKAMLLHDGRAGDLAIAVQQFEDHSAQIESHSARIVRRLNPPLK